MKKYYSIVLAFLLAMCYCVQKANAAEKDDGMFVYNTYKATIGANTNVDCAEIVGFSKSYPDTGGDIELNFNYGTGKVTIEGAQYYLYKLGDSAFSPYNSRYQTWIQGREMCRRITKLYINCSSLQYIGNSTFQGCEKLKDVTLYYVSYDYAIKDIGSYAFESTAIESITLPKNVTVIRNYCFANTPNLKSIDLKNASNIGPYAFYNSGLEYVTLCKELLNSMYDSWDIGEYAFGNCSLLKAVKTTQPTPYSIWANAFSGIPYDAVLIVPDGSESAYASAKGWSAFYHIEGTSLVGKEFEDTIFRYLVLDDDNDNNNHTCEIIGLSSQFTDDHIGWYGPSKEAYCADAMGKWHTFRIIGVGDRAFYYSDLTSADLTNCEYMTYIGERAFANSKELSYVSLPSGMYHIRQGAFEGCSSLYAMNLPDNVEKIGARAYAGSGIHEVSIPANTATIQEETFADCQNLTDVKLPSQIGYVMDHAFSGSSITSVVLNSYLSGDIYSGAFSNCKQLEYVVALAGSPGDIPEDVFKGVKSGAILYVAADSYDHYASLPGWTKYLTLMTMDTTGEEFESYGYKYVVTNFDMEPDVSLSYRSLNLLGFSDDNKNATYVSPPNTVNYKGLEYTITYLEGESFMNNKNIEYVSLPEFIDIIGQSAFKNCTNLTYVYLPLNLYVIGNNAFENTAVEYVYLPEYAGRIGVEAFRNCKQLREVEFSPNMEMVNERAFQGCTSLQEIRLPNLNWVYYGEDAFAESGISRIHIPFNIDTDCFSLGTFRDCKNLLRVQVDIPSPKPFDSRVFSGSYSKATLLVPNGMVGIYSTLGGWKNFYSFYDHNTMPTAIAPPTVLYNATPSHSLYDLQGRRVENPTKGVYIQNGKKVYVK